MGAILSLDGGTLPWKTAPAWGGLCHASPALPAQASRVKENHKVLTYCWLMWMFMAQWMTTVLKHWLWMGANPVNCMMTASRTTLARGLQPRQFDSSISLHVISCLRCDHALISMISIKADCMGFPWEFPGDVLGTLACPPLTPHPMQLHNLVPLSVCRYLTCDTHTHPWVSWGCLH